MNAFEFDPKKSQSNMKKHGIDFFEAQALWQDSNRLELQAKSDYEPRTLAVGVCREKHWSAIVTQKENNIRIISVRRSRKQEVELYES